MALAGGATVACLLLLALAVAAGAASPAPAPAVDCSSAALNLVDCLDYVQPNSTSRRPTKTCCGEVNTAVKDPAVVDCLCGFLADPKQVPIPINMTRILGIPAACGGSANVFSKCHVVPGASGAPTEAPSPSAGTPSSGGSATAPSPKNAAMRSPVTATVLVVSVAAPLLAFYYL